jgi:hypothetical protein
MDKVSKNLLLDYVPRDERSPLPHTLFLYDSSTYVWSPKWSLSFTLLTKILHVISHLSYVSCMLCLCLHVALSFMFSNKKMCTSFLISLTCAACSIHLALLDFML